MVVKITVFCYIVDMTEEEMITVKNYIIEHFPYINMIMDSTESNGTIWWRNPITGQEDGYCILRARKTSSFLPEYAIDLSTDFVFDEYGMITGIKESTWTETPTFSSFYNDFPKIKEIVNHLNKRYKDFLNNIKLLEIEKDF